MWWPSGHGGQPLYELEVQIDVEGGETFKAQRKVTSVSVILSFYIRFTLLLWFSISGCFPHGGVDPGARPLLSWPQLLLPG